MIGMITSKKVIVEELSKKGFAPRKSLGQNFLIDENILQKIVKAGEPSNSDLVLEIGPGLGALTYDLIHKAKHIIAVEYDRGLFSILQEKLAEFENLTLLNQDIMDTDINSIFKEFSAENCTYKVIANLPYYITTPVLFKLLESGVSWKSMVFLVQKEVAQRLTAKPGAKEYGALTVMLNFFGRVEKIAIVPKTVFYPMPQIDSAIVRIIPDNIQYDPELYPYLRQVVQAAFGQRRKTILNSLAGIEDLSNSKETLSYRLQELRIDPRRRGETLSLLEFLHLAKEIRANEYKFN